MVSDQELLDRAVSARAAAHAPYSRYQVGAALLGESGAVFHGCNVEISSFSLTCCAERVAVFKAISEGERRFVAVAVVTADDPPASPCGACRQVLHDFGGPGLRVIIGHADGTLARTFALGELLPHSFGPENLLSRG